MRPWTRCVRLLLKAFMTGPTTRNRTLVYLEKMHEWQGKCACNDLLIPLVHYALSPERKHNFELSHLSGQCKKTGQVQILLPCDRSTAGRQQCLYMRQQARDPAPAAPHQRLRPWGRFRNEPQGCKGFGDLG